MKPTSGVAELQKMLEKISGHLSSYKFYLTDVDSTRPKCLLGIKSSKFRPNSDLPRATIILADKGTITKFGDFNSKLQYQLEAFLNQLKSTIHEAVQAYGLKENSDFSFTIIQNTVNQKPKEAETVQIEVKMKGKDSSGKAVNMVIGKFSFYPSRNVLTGRS